MLITDLSSHLALVTGATGGIGKATCIALAGLGCSIAVHYNSAANDAAELVGQLEAKGVRAQAFQADLGKYEEVCGPTGFISGLVWVLSSMRCWFPRCLHDVAPLFSATAFNRTITFPSTLGFQSSSIPIPPCLKCFVLSLPHLHGFVCVLRRLGPSSPLRRNLQPRLTDHTLQQRRLLLGQVRRQINYRHHGGRL